MIVHWMRVGFVHGVMNTDNMSILGLTIDYGPYGWLDDFDPSWTPNTTDAAGRRYRYGHQPRSRSGTSCGWPTRCVPLFAAQEPLEAGLDAFLRVYDDAYEAHDGGQARLRRPRRGGAALMREVFALLHAARPT